MNTTFKNITAGTFIALLFLAGNSKASELKTTSFDATETVLQLEKWITDEAFWKTNSLNEIDFVQETETSIELENWIINDNIWNLNNKFVEESEAGLELEGWMIDSNLWKQV